jgi:outer membrane protein OmpA-like peptidoglycan-associated protein
MGGCHGTRTALALAGLIAAVLTVPAEAARPCNVVDEDARRAQEAGDLEVLKQLYSEAHDPAANCDSLFLASFGRDVALAHIDRFVALDQQDPNPAAHLPILEEARNYGEPWQLLAMLAGVEADLGHHELAASYYQQVVRELQVASRGIDEGSSAAANLPDKEEFDLIYRHMSESALLAQTFSPPAASRGVDDASGLFPESYRGYVVKEVPVPVQFQFDSTRFTGKGEQVAAYLLDYLIGEKLPHVRLIGHTDPKGDANYNLGLSQRRAEAVRDYLVAGGYSGIIDVEGHGEAEPFQPVDPDKFANDAEAKHQLDRRVELVRDPDY